MALRRHQEEPQKYKPMQEAELERRQDAACQMGLAAGQKCGSFQRRPAAAIDFTEAGSCSRIHKRHMISSFHLRAKLPCD